VFIVGEVGFSFFEVNVESNNMVLLVETLTTTKLHLYTVNWKESKGRRKKNVLE